MELLTVKTEDYVSSIVKRKNEMAKELEELRVNYGYCDRIGDIEEKIYGLLTIIDVFTHYNEETLQIDLDKFKLMIRHHSIELDF